MPSLVNKKYIYGVDKDYANLTSLLFSDQCIYSFVPRIHERKKDHASFLDLILNEQVYLSDYKDHEHSAFRYLADFDLIEISSDGLILVNNKVKVAVLKDIYKNEVVSRWHYPAAALSEIQELVDKGIFIEKSSLLSTPETNYLNYLLNRSEYDNGLEIRNKYIHGIQQVNTDENEHMQNYLNLIKIFVLLAIKVNDDFELRKMIEKREKNDQF